jgi:acetylornithine/N-succinyldiaminopimelate aminotransferase
MAKGIGGGLPLGGILVTDELSEVWTKGMHGTTYGGNAVACVTGNVVIEELKNGLMDKVVEVGNYLHLKLNELKNKYPKVIVEVRGIALMAGILLAVDAGEFLNKLIENKAIANVASGKVLRIVPPLIITKADVDEFIEKLDKTLSVY